MGIIFAGVALASEIPPDEIRALSTFEWKLPSQLSVSRLERLLQSFTDAAHGVGFRYLGVDEDAGHGHLLVEARGTGDARRLFPRAILYHTQENAYAAHWRTEPQTPARFDYLNVTTRNWLQWLNDDGTLDGRPVENARVYVDERKKPPAQFFEENAAPRRELHYTIHSHELDPAKLGFAVFGDLQFEFYDDDCTTPRNDFYRQRRGPIAVRLRNGARVCLSLTTTSGMREFRQGNAGR